MAITRIKILESGDEALVEAYLLPRLESSMFLLSNMRQAGLTDNGERYAGTYVASMDDRQVTGVVAHFNQGNLICQAPIKIVSELATAAINHSDRQVHGVVGPADQVQKISDKLEITPSSIQMDETEHLYRLILSQMKIPEPLQSGALLGRRIEPRDLDQLTEWRVAYEMEALGSDDTPHLHKVSRAGMERSLHEGTGWVVEFAGQRVSFSGFNALLKEAVQIGGVWTPPNLRGRGYARGAVATSLIDARAEGVATAILFTDYENIPAQTAYEALGFQRVGDYRLLLLNTPIEPNGITT